MLYSKISLNVHRKNPYHMEDGPVSLDEESVTIPETINTDCNFQELVHDGCITLCTQYQFWYRFIIILLYVLDFVLAI